MFTVLSAIAILAVFALVAVAILKVGADTEGYFGEIILVGLIGDAMQSLPAPRGQEPELPPFVFRDAPVYRAEAPQQIPDRMFEPRAA